MRRSRAGFVLGALCLSLSVVAPAMGGSVDAGAVPPPKDDDGKLFDDSREIRAKGEEDRKRREYDDESRLANPFFGDPGAKGDMNGFNIRPGINFR